MGVVVMSGLYREDDPTRFEEYLECLRRTSSNPWVDEVQVLLEDDLDVDRLVATVTAGRRATVDFVPLGRRVTYADFFARANELAAGTVVAIVNADIWFDATLGLVVDAPLDGRFLALSRWDDHPDGSTHHFDRADSQDAWIFSVPVAPIDAAIELGRPGCDNRLAWEARRAGLEVVNPSRAIRARHLHQSAIRNYSEADRVHGLTAVVAPTGFRNERRRLAAVTSLPPDPAQVDRVRGCIASWRGAGAEVFACNHPDEIEQLSQWYDVGWVPVPETTVAEFGRHYVPIDSMLRWSAGERRPTMIVNADIELAIGPVTMERFRHVVGDGLGYVPRHNYTDDRGHATVERDGIDVFLVDGARLPTIPRSSLSMGQPFWDYWLPVFFLDTGRPLTTLDGPVAYHRTHDNRWSWAAWSLCAEEFVRLTGRRWPADRSCWQSRSAEIRDEIRARTRALPPEPFDIRAWAVERFGDDAPTMVLELGAHQGTDTEWLASLPGVTLHAFEPDPRNMPPPLPNVTVHRRAISDRTGVTDLIPSAEGWGQEWTMSSSIKAPARHLVRYPVTFGRPVAVETVTLDEFARAEGIGTVDFIWADIQGAEAEMIRGGFDTLARTRYLYTEYSDDELYAEQVSLDDILRMLPDFRVVEQWPDDVLLENRVLADSPQP